MIDAYVVKIVDNGLIPINVWYRKQVGYLYVCTFNGESYSLFNNDIDIMQIDIKHAKVITKFQTEDDY